MPYRIKSLAGKPYQPSNGTEGMMFFEKFCDHCIFESEANPCPLIGTSMAYVPGDKEYPTEWTHDDEGRPICTKFKPLGSYTGPTLEDLEAEGQLRLI